MIHRLLLARRRPPMGPIAQSLALAHGVLAVEEQPLGPDGQIVCTERGFQPRLIGGERREQVGQAGALELADVVLNDRMRAVGASKPAGRCREISSRRLRVGNAPRVMIALRTERCSIIAASALGAVVDRA